MKHETQNANLPVETAAKLERVKKILRETGGCAIAYSGGLDSSLLLTIAREVLGERCIGIIASSPIRPKNVIENAIKWLIKCGIRHDIVFTAELEQPEFRENPRHRCYLCKIELFNKIREKALAYDFAHIADGTNADDAGEFRPGLDAARELGIASPLLDAGLTKDEIRLIAKNVYHLPMAGKPATTCLATRLPYNSKITQSKLERIHAVESFLDEKGFTVCRARCYGKTLRLELEPQEMEKIVNSGLRSEFVRFARIQGFAYVTLDLEGFRSGSMDEPFSPP